MDQQHEMLMENTHSSGAEEWYCPTCGRRMTILWEPWKKIVLEPGDIYAAHSLSKGGLQIGAVQITEGTEDPYLAPWAQWLANVDLDNMGNEEN